MLRHLYGKLKTNHQERVMKVEMEGPAWLKNLLEDQYESMIRIVPHFERAFGKNPTELVTDLPQDAEVVDVAYDLGTGMTTSENDKEGGFDPLVDLEVRKDLKRRVRARVRGLAMSKTLIQMGEMQDTEEFIEHYKDQVDFFNLEIEPFNGAQSIASAGVVPDTF